MADIKSDYFEAINNGLADGTPCLVGTVSAENTPEISPKGSVVVYDAQNIAYWERAYRGAASNIQANSNVVIYYRNADRAESLPQGAALRFYGTASVVEDDAVRNAIYDMMCEREQNSDAERKGQAVMVKIDRVTSLRGDDV
jgi:hypothetical protein